MLQAGTEPAQTAVACYDPVAGDDKRDGVGAAGLAHGPGGLGVSQTPAQFLIGHGFPRGDLPELLPDPQVEGAALEIQGQGQHCRPSQLLGAADPIVGNPS